jgi:hypothetical protein
LREDSGRRGKTKNEKKRDCVRAAAETSHGHAPR